MFGSTLRSHALVAFLAMSAAAHAQTAPVAPAHRALPTAEERAKLPPDGGPDFNRLVFEQSPYLLQHATNPVDWYPWGPAAFARAKELNRPIFLSIGYSTCHWCHVMARESFADAQVAAYLNEHFVSIKVDREERPDVDEVYVAYCTTMTGSAGWPLTIVATPEGKPFFAGTYFPKADEKNMPGFATVLEKLAGAWEKDHAAVLTHADQMFELVRLDMQRTAGEIDAREVTERAVRGLATEFDKEHGGFGTAPKFPMTSSLRLLLRWSERRGDGQAQFFVDRTLDAIACGGIHDHLDGGFHRYTTDREWRVPHFEKMLYDQALLALTFCEAFEQTGRVEWSAVAQRTLDYVLARLRAPSGGFYSAEDADSADGEGAFYLWTRAELCAGAATCPAAEIFHVTATSSAAELRTRVPHLTRPYLLPDREVRLSNNDLARRNDFVPRLLELRAKRARPARDEKILTDWNGLAIAALAHTGRATGRTDFVEAAARTAAFALEHLRRPDGRLWKRSAGGVAAVDGVLDDSAYLAWGLIELYAADGDPRWLREAVQVTDMCVGQFQEDGKGGFFRSAHAAEKLVLRTQPTSDSSLPSPSAVAVANLLRLARITGSEVHERHARAALQACAADTSRDPIGHAEMLAAHDLLLAPSIEIVIAGPRNGADTAALLAQVRGRFLPNAVLVLRATDAAKDEVTELAPWTKDLVARDGVATAYVCREHVCSAPTSDPAELARLLAHPYAATPPKAAAPAPK